MRLYAESIAASAADTSFAGAVHSVFPRALNVCKDRRLVQTVVTCEVANVPRGIVVAPPPAFSFAREVRPGAAVSLRNGLLRIGRDLCIDVRGATVWNDDVRARNVDLASQDQRLSWRVALREPGLKGSSTSGAMRVATDTGESLSINSLLPPPASDTDQLDKRRLDAVCAMFIGAGPGLTPSGDDFLVGYLAGLWSAAGVDGARIAYVTALAGVVVDNAVRTGSISRFYLENACKGRVTQKLMNLVQSIAGGASPSHIRRVTAQAIAVGSSSGVAGVTGLLLGLAAWHPDLVAEYGASVWSTVIASVNHLQGDGYVQ